MILMWLGSVFLMIVGALLMRQGIAVLLAPLQKKFLVLTGPAPTLKMLIYTKLCDFAQASFLKNQYSAVALMNSRSFSKRYAVLLLCLSAAGLWTTMVGLLVMWQMHGHLFFILPVFGLFVMHRWPLIRGVMLASAGLGIMLNAGLRALRYQDSLLSALGESEFHFLLADGRFSAQLIWLVAAFVLTLLIRIESWTAFLALALLGVGSLSLNGAIAMVIGELLAHVWILAYRSRRLNNEVKVVTRNYALVSTAGLVLGFFLAGNLREIFSWGYTFDANPLMVKSLQFFSMYFVVVVAQVLAVLTWGHFAAHKKIDEVQKGDYFSTQWISHGLIGSEIMEFIIKKLSERLDLLKTQQKNINAADRAKMPKSLIEEHEQEIVKLTMWVPVATSALGASWTRRFRRI